MLTGATVLLYPSRYEGFGLPPLEAMACGTPAVVSDIPALRESTAGTARLVPPGDVDGWADALRDGLRGRLSRPTPPTRSCAIGGTATGSCATGRIGRATPAAEGDLFHHVVEPRDERVRRELLRPAAGRTARDQLAVGSVVGDDAHLLGERPRASAAAASR